MQKFWLTFILAAICSSARAQLAESDTLALQYELAATFFLTKGNVDRTLAKTEFSLRHVERGWGMASGNAYLHGSFRGLATERDVLSKNFVYLFPKRRFYPYLMLWLETNLRRKIDFRQQAGPGASYAIRRDTASVMKLSATLSYEHTLFDGDRFVHAPARTGSTLVTLRITGRLYGEHLFAGDKLAVQYELWYQPSLQDGNNYRYHVDGILKAPLARHFSLKMSMNYTYERVVLQGVKNCDLYWTIGLSHSN